MKKRKISMKELLKSENLDEKIIHEIMTRRRCDFIRKPPIIEVEVDGEKIRFQFGSFKEWENFAKRKMISQGKIRVKGRYDYAIRHLKALSNDDNIPKKDRQKYEKDHHRFEALRNDENAWGKRERRITALKRSGKCIKKIEEVRQEILMDLQQYVEKACPGISLLKTFKMTAAIWQREKAETIPSGTIKSIYWNFINNKS